VKKAIVLYLEILSDIILKIVVIIIIINHAIGFNTTVSASSNALCKRLPCRLRPFGLQFSIISGILLLFIPATCRSQFDLHLLSFSLTGFTSNPIKIFIPFVVKQSVSCCSSKKCHVNR
jgi:hypothetical protein